MKQKGMGIKAKLFFSIVPFVVIALILLTAISGSMSRNIIQNQIHSNMAAELESNSTDINDKLTELRTTAKDMAASLGTTYQLLEQAVLVDVFEHIMSSNNLVWGAGAWFEPNAYDPNARYTAPYFYKDGDTFVQIDNFTSGAIDYFNEDWYIWAKSADRGMSVVLDPVYDEVLGYNIIRTVSPMYNAEGTFVGAITVDMQLETFDHIISEIHFGDQAEFCILTADGTYVYSADPEKAQSHMTIYDVGEPFASAAGEALLNEAGNTSYETADDTMHLYYCSIPTVGWKLVTRISDNAMYGEVAMLIRILIIICVAAVAVCIIAIFVQASGMAKAIRRVETFADDLAKGDFTVEKLVSKRKDEIGVMAGALNTMYDNNRGMIGKISNNSTHVHDSSTKLHDVAKELHDRVKEIHNNMSRVNDAMMSSSAATEEVSASVNEVNSSVQKLAEETGRTDEHVQDIKMRAEDIQKHSSGAFESAKEIYAMRSEELEAAKKKAEVVKEIGNLANAIADIADQINLLSLNASIEAARAGEHGKGFAVVASEINKLAAETGDAVEQIQTTIDAVQDAFTDLSAGANNLLEFVSDQVTPDYESFVEVGRQYGEDAESFARLTADIREMIGFVRESMDQVNAAITNIAESTQDTASNSSEITETVSEVNEMVGDVSQMVYDQTEVAKDLHGIVTQYKL